MPILLGVSIVFNRLDSSNTEPKSIFKTFPISQKQKKPPHALAQDGHQQKSKTILP